MNTNKFKALSRPLQRVQVCAAGVLDVMPGMVEADLNEVLSDLGHQLSLTIKQSIAADKLPKTIKFNTATPANWFEHLKHDVPFLQKIFGKPKMVVFSSEVDVNFAVCFPDYVMPKNMGTAYVTSVVAEDTFKVADSKFGMTMEVFERFY